MTSVSPFRWPSHESLLRDMLEAMTATMLVGAQHAALDSLRRVMHPDQTAAGRELYESLAFKGMRAFAQLFEALNSEAGQRDGAARQRGRESRRDTRPDIGD